EEAGESASQFRVTSAGRGVGIEGSARRALDLVDAVSRLGARQSRRNQLKLHRSELVDATIFSLRLVVGRDLVGRQQGVSEAALDGLRPAHEGLGVHPPGDVFGLLA